MSSTARITTRAWPRHAFWSCSRASGARSEWSPGDVHLEVGGCTRYRVEGAVFRTFEAARAAQGHRASAFAQVSLMNRYASRQAALEMIGLGERASAAFASATDLGPGLERPLVLKRGALDGSVTALLNDCPARTLLRIYWPLERV